MTGYFSPRKRAIREEVSRAMQEIRRKRWLPRVLERRTEIRAGRAWAVESLAPVTAADLKADGCTFKRHSANAELR
jgi:hypothetical protein